MGRRGRNRDRIRFNHRHPASRRRRGVRGPLSTTRAERDEEIHLDVEVSSENPKGREECLGRLTLSTWQATWTWLSFELWNAVLQPGVVPKQIISAIREVVDDKACHTRGTLAIATVVVATNLHQRRAYICAAFAWGTPERGRDI